MPIFSVIVYSVVASLDSKICKQLFYMAWKDQIKLIFFNEKPKLKIISVGNLGFVILSYLKFPSLTVCWLRHGAGREGSSVRGFFQLSLSSAWGSHDYPKPTLIRVQNPTLIRLQNPTLIRVQNPTLIRVQNPTLIRIQNLTLIRVRNPTLIRDWTQPSSEYETQPWSGYRTQPWSEYRTQPRLNYRTNPWSEYWSQPWS